MCPASAVSNAECNTGAGKLRAVAAAGARSGIAGWASFRMRVTRNCRAYTYTLPTAPSLAASVAPIRRSASSMLAMEFAYERRM